MVWQDPTPTVDQLRTQLIGTAAFIAMVNNAGQESARVHFPVANPQGIDGSTRDPVPLVVIKEANVAPQRYAEGAGGLRNALFELTFVFPVGSATDAHTVGVAEKRIQDMCNQLLQQQPSGTPAGLIPFKTTGIEIEPATSPTPGAKAADSAGNPTAFRTVIARLPYGLTA